MIEISSRAKTASRRCDEILSLDYFDLMDVKKDVENDVKNVLKMECKTEPCASSKLQCQFPNHETLLNELRTCAKIVSGTKYNITETFIKGLLVTHSHTLPNHSVPYYIPQQIYLFYFSSRRTCPVTMQTNQASDHINPVESAPYKSVSISSTGIHIAK